MSEHHVTIDAQGPCAKITVDGHDLSNILSGLVLQLEAQDKPQLLLALSPQGLNITTSVEGDAVVVLDEATHALLEAIGWTPPDPA